LYVDDAAEGIVRAAEAIDDPTPVNLGTGGEITIRDLVELVAELCEFKGTIRWDASKPDGQPRRCVDSSRAEALLGWRAQTSLRDGLRSTIEWYRSAHRGRMDAQLEESRRGDSRHGDSRRGEARCASS
jgi:GDP-L-fucose synthase